MREAEACQMLLTISQRLAATLPSRARIKAFKTRLIIAFQSAKTLDS
jgi:hypothetical protein